MFKQQVLFSVVSLLVSVSWAAKPPTKIQAEKQLIEELTGKPASQVPSAQNLKNKPLATQHYFAGLRAFESKNYIKAIKHFNTVLKNHPQSLEVKSAFSAKARVYTEMGLLDSAKLNLAKAASVKSSAKKSQLSQTSLKMLKAQSSKTNSTSVKK